MSRKIWYIQQLNLFKDFAKDTLQKIDEAFAMKEYEKTEVVFEPGDKDKVFIVKTGQVEVYHITESGKKVIIERLKPGSFFGDLGTHSDQDVYVEATTNSYVCSIHKDTFFSMVSQYPSLSEKLMKQLFNRLLRAETRISSVITDNAMTRLYKFFKSHGDKEPDNTMKISESFTHEEIAQMIGISRQTVTTLINQLESKGILKRRNKTLYLIPDKVSKESSS